ncbi:hypothetical protein KC332_g9099 [Hortaea werneckii]|nr:hypothetical protein KC358_g9964 [Hortaea werneckii]KAI6825517.1 hypothetical protein KC350_g8764 [Hortaea werneckii]KAI6921549.1 hypothetical protein KC348_g10107 [Hortaea werneckii]KAI6931327.1 hypothetical protein KC341_g9678 [Hortaea werneckii]KAI6965795.1 hypothetical protein KC321_g9929 [Hortaea werneckii]
MARGDRSNTADQIEDKLPRDGHLVWGFAVYRCTYGDDAAWKTCLECLNKSMRDSMRFYNGLELLEPERFKLTILDDKSQFDGASAQVVRQHFRDWRSNVVHREQGSQKEIEARGGSSNFLDYKNSARYRFCIQIDEASLQSIVSSEGEIRPDEAWVNSIEADWDLGAAAAQREEDKIMHVEDGLDPEDFEDEEPVFPEIDGCTEENVGFMRVHFMDLIPEMYHLLGDPDAIDYLYIRPPALAQT